MNVVDYGVSKNHGEVWFFKLTSSEDNEAWSKLFPPASPPELSKIIILFFDDQPLTLVAIEAIREAFPGLAVVLTGLWEHRRQLKIELVYVLPHELRVALLDKKHLRKKAKKKQLLGLIEADSAE